MEVMLPQLKLNRIVVNPINQPKKAIKNPIDTNPSRVKITITPIIINATIKSLENIRPINPNIPTTSNHTINAPISKPANKGNMTSIPIVRLPIALPKSVSGILLLLRPLGINNI